ncbi:MAG: tRNA pseudouridine(38-40) synthase TruA [Lachnospiraceae bacterium]|nr:tRNA pseudouridine(38-40) synthase TruA [Lachnospiraceae bacterium]
MKRVLLTVAYDGTSYHGFQIQKNAPTIAGELLRAIRDLTGCDAELLGGSRTDAGVHAFSNKTAFDTDSPIEADKFAYALNARLPEDIRVTASREVPGDFHPLRVPSRKTYEYRILNTEFPDPVSRLHTVHVHVPLDDARMDEASKYLLGEHDFASFCSAGSQVESTVRTIHEIGVSKEPLRDRSGRMRRDGKRSPSGLLIIRVTGNGFLYNMVRIIAGTLMEVGRGAMEPEEVLAVLEAHDRDKAGPTAPPQGLFLVRYEFTDIGNPLEKGAPF